MATTCTTKTLDTLTIADENLIKEYLNLPLCHMLRTFQDKAKEDEFSAKMIFNLNFRELFAIMFCEHEMIRRKIDIESKNERAPGYFLQKIRRV